MSEIQLAHFSFGGEAADQSRFHDVAIREARATTDHQAGERATTRHRSLASRLGLGSRIRLAFAGGRVATTEACNCPA